MLKDFTIANLLDLNETIAKDLFEGKTYPWEVLPEIGDFILKLGQTLSEEEPVRRCMDRQECQSGTYSLHQRSGHHR
mgnify:CR=1 FL=1